VVLAVVVGVAAALALYHRSNDEIRCGFETKIGDYYRDRGLKVSLRSAERVEGQGLRFRDISIIELGAEGPHAELMHIEEMFVECSTDWRDLVQDALHVRRVRFRRPTLRATHRPDGSWSSAKLLPPPQFGEHPPEVVVEGGGVVEIFDPLKAPAGTLTLRDVALTLIPSVGSPPPTNLPSVSGEGVAGKTPDLPLASGTRPGSKPSGIRRLEGTFAGDGFRRVEINGWVDPQTSACSIRGQADAVEISPELRDSLPSSLTAKLPALDVRGQGNLRFEIGYDPTAKTPLTYSLVGKLMRGRIDDARLPHALSEIRATVRVDNSGCAIDDLAARSGQGTLRMTYNQTGFEPDSPLKLTAEVRQLDLDRSLLSLLPQSIRDQWYNYHPAGTVDADVQLSYDGRAWHRDVAVRCLNVAFTYHKFPYPLDHGRGTLDLKDDRIKLNLTAYSGSQPVRLEAEILHPFAGPTGWFKAEGDEIQLDKSLLSALPEKSAEVVRSLDPRGTVNFYVRIWRDKSHEPMHEHLILTLNHCSMRYEKFPYPLSDVRGRLEMFDGAWTFQDLEAVNDKARVTCKEGRLTPGLQGNELVLNLNATNVALREDLRAALSPHMQQIWLDMRPSGTVDLAADIHYLSESKKFSLGVRVEPQPDSTSIEPVRFPYRLERLKGVLDYRDGHVEFKGCKGEHGAVKVSSDGSCDFKPDGRWSIRFTSISADRLRTDTDREFVQALPERLRKIVTEANPTGPINLRGRLEFERTGQANEPMSSRWDLRLGLQQSSLQFGGLLVDNVHGEASFVGGFDGEQLQSRGELDLQSLKYKECQLTQVSGPIWVDNGRILFGAWVDHRNNGVVPTDAVGPPRAQRPLAARFCGGNFYANGWVTLEATPRYVVNATLTDADLARCAQEFAVGHRNLRGKIMATANLTGSGRTRNTLSGDGGIQLTEANVYELPVMISLLKILSIRSPDQNAFSDASMKYQIQGEHIYLDPIVFHGDAISLRGKGELNFQSQIGLTFYATVGRGELDLPVIKQVFSGASQQMMRIHVDGTLQNPETRREALPAVNQVLQEITGEGPSRR
jgi:hypothetical protein